MIEAVGKTERATSADKVARLDFGNVPMTPGRKNSLSFEKSLVVTKDQKGLPSAADKRKMLSDPGDPIERSRLNEAKTLPGDAFKHVTA